MKSFSFLTAGVVALVVASSPALALSARTFVSGAGSDAGACPVTTPCRTFSYALTQTAPSGEIIVLSSAGYGAVTINKAVSIINTSNFAGVTVASGDGITINAGANDSVTLRGLTIDGGGTGLNGIVYNSGGKLTIDQCDVMNFSTTGSGGNGIFVRPTSGTHKISITNTTTSNNREGTRILIDNSATVVIVMDRVNANNNASAGVSIQNFGSGGVAASVSNSIASFNGNSGFFFRGLTASLDSSYAASNAGPGVYVYTSATLALGRSVIMNNDGYGVLNVDGAVNSYKDNRIAGNTLGPVSATPAAATLY